VSAQPTLPSPAQPGQLEEEGHLEEEGFPESKSCEPPADDEEQEEEEKEEKTEKKKRRRRKNKNKTVMVKIGGVGSAESDLAAVVADSLAPRLLLDDESEQEKRFFPFELRAPPRSYARVLE
jgi:hypothetical protein